MERMARLNGVIARRSGKNGHIRFPATARPTIHRFLLG
jgi:hypothetical protein